MAGVRQAAAVALGGIGPEAKTAVPALTDLLNDKERAVRHAAASALGNVGPEAKTAIPALTELLKEQGVIRETAAEALTKIHKAKK